MTHSPFSNFWGREEWAAKADSAQPHCGQLWRGARLDRAGRLLRYRRKEGG